MKEIRIAFRPGPVLSHHDMHEFQDELKVIDEKDLEHLCQQIVDTGFAFSPHVWKDPSADKWMIVDAHQRKKALQRLEQRGYSIPVFHTIEVLADSFEQAKQRVLQGTSQYGRMTPKGLADFSMKAGIRFEALGSFRFPEVKLSQVESHFRNQVTDDVASDASVEWAEELGGQNDYLVLVFNSREEFDKACEKLGIETKRYNLSASGHEAFDRMGIGRVLKAEAVLARL
jgi:hypothetical protein